MNASGKEPACQCRRCKRGVEPLGGEDPLEEEMAAHSSILAWKIPQTEELVGYSPCDHKRVGRDLATKQQTKIE